MYEVKDARPPHTEPFDTRYQYGTSTFIMPDGSAVCYTHDTPDEIVRGLIAAWREAMSETNQPTNEPRSQRMSDDDFYKEWEGDRFAFTGVGDQLTGTLTERTKKQGQRGPVLVLHVDDGEKDWEVWAPTHLAQLCAERKPQVGDRVRITLTDLKSVGQPQPMKMFKLEVQRTDGAGVKPEPVAAADDGSEPF